MESVEAFEVYPENVEDSRDSETNDEIAGERGITVEEAKERILRVCKTVLEMLRDRGFTCESYEKPKIGHGIVGNDDDDEKELDADKIFPNGYNTQECITLWGNKDKKICVRIYLKQMSMKQLTDEVKKFKGPESDKQEGHTGFYDNQEYYDPIFVVPSIQKLASKSLHAAGVQWFTHEELLVNITHHMLVPKFYVLSDAEKKEFLKCYHLKNSQLPKMLSGDPISRYYGLKKDDIVKITRKSVTAGKYVYYRIIV